MFTRSLAAAVLLVTSPLALTACGEADDTTAETSDTTTTVAPDAGTDSETKAGAVTVANAWARNSPAMASAGAAYLDLVGGDEDDALLSASVDPSVAGTVELHETVAATTSDTAMGDDAMGDSMDDSSTSMEMGDDSMEMGDGAMKMQPVTSIKVPAGSTVSLKPGGYHVMLLDLAAPLELGDSFKLTLTFENAGEQVIDVPVQEAP